MRKRLTHATLYVQGDIKKSINRGNRTGKNPSKPGEPPKRVEGDLFRSIKTLVTERGGDMYGFVYTDDPKARRLELGFSGADSRGRVYRTAPRPFMRPGLKRNLRKIKEILKAK